MKISVLPKNLLLGLIGLYQKSLSPDHGWFKHQHPHGYCRFYPSCSEYARQAVTKHGAVRGSGLSAMRLLRCHPWAQPKIDNVPNS
ncbi:MAG: membrane protein insertion efficiency factor YidD [Patescibacteria group bacterium]|nr:membrane protein insertion efficiency factor YidD [Patescibacteria group bacterium]